MTSRKKDFFEAQGYRNIGKSFFIALIILIVAVVGFGIYFLYFSVDVCSDYQCFLDAVSGCDKVSFVKEDLNANWYYEIIGSRDSGCEVKVELVRINEGSVKNEVLVGKSMICEFSNNGGFPEDDLFSCSGSLREGIQEKIINDMHVYLLENIGEIKEGFKGI